MFCVSLTVLITLLDSINRKLEVHGKRSGTTDPLDLYKWVDEYETKTGGRTLAISHNGNLSNGWMFPLKDTYAGGKVNKEYVELRAKWEPLYEVTQIKGDGETHPFYCMTENCLATRGQFSELEISLLY